MQTHSSSFPAGGHPLVNCLEGPIAAISLVGSVGVTSRTADVFERTACLNPAAVARLAAALETEIAYLDQVLDFTPAIEPDVPAPRKRETAYLAALFDMHQAICLVACNPAGDVVVARHYHTEEFTRLLRVRESLAEHLALLLKPDSVSGPSK